MNKYEVPIISINTDASFHPEHKIGGYAYYIMCTHFKVQISGVFKKGIPKDSNEAELLCIEHALSMLLEKDYMPYTQHLVINTDSLNAIEEIIRQETNIGKNVNRLWQLLIKRTRARKNELMHVPSHSHEDNQESWINNWCDEESKRAMRENIPEQQIG